MKRASDKRNRDHPHSEEDLDSRHERDQKEEGRHDHVPSEHVGEQTHHEGEGLGEDAEELHWDHDGQEPEGKPRWNQVLQVARQAELGDSSPLLCRERHDGEPQRDGEVGRGAHLRPA